MLRKCYRRGDGTEWMHSGPVRDLTGDFHVACNLTECRVLNFYPFNPSVVDELAEGTLVMTTRSQPASLSPGCLTALGGMENFQQCLNFSPRCMRQRKSTAGGCVGTE